MALEIRGRVEHWFSENMVMMELLKSRTAQGRNPELYFYRDSHGNEMA